MLRTQSREPQSHDRRVRRGAILVAVLVTLFVAMLICAALAQSLFIHKRQSALLENHRQAFWLAESGLDRAVVALRNSDEYQGETWTVAAKHLDGRHEALVTISVERPENSENDRVIRVRAQYPHDSHRQTTYSQQWTIKTPSS